MNFEYEENLQENPFFVKIMERHNALINEVGNGSWVILIPKRAQITEECLKSNEFLLSHILLPSDELPKTHFTNLIGIDITINDKFLRIKGETRNSSQILFEEIFYTKDMQKFKVLCIETPLCAKFIQLMTTSNLVQNLSESIQLLTQVKGGGLRKIENAVSNFKMRILKASDYVKLSKNVKLLYEYCLNVLCPKKKLDLDPFQTMNLKIALEYYLMDAVYEKIFDAISTHHSEDNQKFNKILRKLSAITIDDLNISKTFTENINLMKIELSKISGCRNSLDKLYCIRNAIVTCNNEKLMTTDEILPILVFVMIKTSFFHWISTLIFIREFNFSQFLGPENQSAGSAMFYILTTLEAVIYFIQTNENLPIKRHQLFEMKKVDEIGNEGDYLEYLFQYVKDSNEIQLMQLINVNYESFILSSQEAPALCHPLCTCSSCRLQIDGFKSNINLKSTNNISMLHVASAYNCAKMTTILMNLGADVNAKDSKGWTSLHFAAHRGHQKVLFLLLHGKSNINALTNQKQSPLLLAAHAGHDCCVKAFLYFADHSMLAIDLNAQDSDGNTALHYASQAGYESIIDGLIEYQAKVTVKNNLGKTPLDYAFSSNIREKLESAAKYQVEELPVNEQDYVFISNEDLADNLDDVC